MIPHLRLRWTITGYWTNPDPNAYIVIVRTDIPVTLTLQFNFWKSRAYGTYTPDRGLAEHETRRFPFRAYTTHLQANPGDSLYHLFPILAWQVPFIYQAKFTATRFGLPTSSNAGLFTAVTPFHPTRNLAAPAHHMVFIDSGNPDANYHPAAWYDVFKEQLHRPPTIHRIVFTFDTSYASAVPGLNEAILLLWDYWPFGQGDGNQAQLRILGTYFNQTTATWNFPWPTPGGDFFRQDYLDLPMPVTQAYIITDITALARKISPFAAGYSFILKPKVETWSFYGFGHYLASNLNPNIHERPYLLMSIPKPI